MQKIISAIKPTCSSPTLGNYFGAIKPLIDLQDKYSLYVFIADLHALTLPIEKKALKQNIENLIAVYLAAGLDTNKVIFFKQSAIPAHNQLEWLLTCNTNVCEFMNMPQYKNYVDKNGAEAVPAGMLLYPSLMNADILLYDADYVFVGADQKPHVDFARDIAERFNRRYLNSFTVPQVMLPATGAKIMSLSDPTKKMSKSESDKGTIYLLEDVDITRKKIMRAVTDSESKIYYDPDNKPGISNLLTIFAAVSNTSIDYAADLFRNEPDYGVFKRVLADILCAKLKCLQDTTHAIQANPNILATTTDVGNDIAACIANNKIKKIYKKIGLN